MEEESANLYIIDGEEEPFQIQGEVQALIEDYKQCLVVSYLTISVVHFPSMRNKMADSWHPLRGISITDIGDKRCLFRFFYEVHDLPLGLMPESMARKFRIFLETFFNYDVKIVVSKMKRFMRIKARLDVWLLLKRKKNIALELNRFCPGHGESFCPVRVTVESSKIMFGWDISLKALWRIAPLIASQRLREPGVSTSQSLDKERREIRRLTIWEPAINNVGPNDTRLMELGSDVEDNPFSFFNDKNKQHTIGEILIFRPMLILFEEINDISVGSAVHDNRPQ
ncbi:hypothetical protein Goari_019909 [Gossypium aridum]|uniref:Uncharacterized protein n=1 Tax=Gossypium aridum TaxID=34290 RepID=A0A7J8WUI3_GOSAI|nr:hypothetical protein [Gossypium aridum]